MITSDNLVAAYRLLKENSRRIKSAAAGDRGNVLFNGLRTKYVTRCKVGVDGWIESYVKTAKGFAYTRRDGKVHITLIKKHGVVHFIEKL